MVYQLLVSRYYVSLPGRSDIWQDGIGYLAAMQLEFSMYLNRQFPLTVGFGEFGRKFSRSALAFGALCSLVVLPHTAKAAEEVGKSVRIKNQVNASIDNRSLAPSDPVFASESISAASASHGEIRLNDNSKVLVGENSVISLDDFVVGGRGFSSGTIKVAKGAFRFITGNSQKGTFKVETPVSTIGVRGTLFDVYVSPGGQTRVLLFRGEVEVCSSSNCIVTNRACDVVDVDNVSAQEVDYLRSGDRQQENSLYNLTDRQTRFQGGWRAPTLRCDVRAALDPSRRNRNQNDNPLPGRGAGDDKDYGISISPPDRGKDKGRDPDPDPYS